MAGRSMLRTLMVTLGLGNMIAGPQLAPELPEGLFNGRKGQKGQQPIPRRVRMGRQMLDVNDAYRRLTREQAHAAELGLLERRKAKAQRKNARRLYCAGRTAQGRALARMLIEKPDAFGTHELLRDHRLGALRPEHMPTPAGA